MASFCLVTIDNTYKTDKNEKGNIIWILEIPLVGIYLQTKYPCYYLYRDSVILYQRTFN